MILSPPRLDLLDMFDLSQCVRDPTHVKGHTIDWLICRCDDNVLQSTTVSSAITTDHCCVMARLNAVVPRTPPIFATVCNVRAVDRTAFCDDVKSKLSDLPSVVAGDLDNALRDVLDVHAPATKRKVSSFRARNAPWFNSVSNEVKADKQQRRRAERQWLKTGLTIHKHLLVKLKSW